MVEPIQSDIQITLYDDCILPFRIGNLLSINGGLYKVIRDTELLPPKECKEEHVIYLQKMGED